MHFVNNSSIMLDIFCDFVEFNRFFGKVLYKIALSETAKM